MKKIALLFSLVAACGDDNNHVTPDGAVDIDGAVDAPGFVKPTPFALPLSATGPDQLMSVVAGPSGTFYAAGFAAPSVTGARNVIVVKLTATGAFDTAFATNGVFTSTLEFKGGSDEIDLVTQYDGKIVVSATIANAADAADRDIGLFRLTTTGTLDATFGTAGTSIVNLSTGHNNGTVLVALDASRGLAVGPADELFLHAASRGEGNAMAGGPRTDTDFTVAKLTANGILDLTYGGGDGKFLLDIQESAATPRGLRVLAGGEVIAGGYANSPGVGTVQPVLYKLTAGGALDTTFASGGVFHETVLALQTEVYNFGIDGTRITTAGYGRATGTTNDWVAMRFDVNTGARDTNFGGAANGAVVIDPSAVMLGSNCRNALALPGGKTLLVGSTGPSNMPAQDAAFAVLTQDGRLDTTYGGGVHTFKLGADGNDQFWGVAVSAGNVMFVGWKGGGGMQTETVNDDAYGVMLPVM